MLSRENAHEAVVIMFEQAVMRMEELNEPGRRCLYEEYKEWIEGFGDKGQEQDAIIFKYMFKPLINSTFISSKQFELRNESYKFSQKILLRILTPSVEGTNKQKGKDKE